MILSDRDIRKQIESGRVIIEPFDEAAIQPSSIDLHVDDTFRIFANSRYPYIDVKMRMDDLTEEVRVAPDEPFILHPGEFVLGSTLEKVSLPDDVVARIEGKSSLGRLGLLIHSSLPGDEPVMLLHEGTFAPIDIETIVRKRMAGSVVAFNPSTLDVGYHPITDWYEGPPDRIFEVRLRSGRSLRVTGGHCVFTLDRDGVVRRTRTLELAPGARVAIARRIPDPRTPSTTLDLLALAPESAWPKLVVEGGWVNDAFERWGEDVGTLLKRSGRKHVSFYRQRGRLPLDIALQFAGFDRFGVDRLGFRGSRQTLPMIIEVSREVAWLVGLYVAEGSRRDTQVTVTNTKAAILDRAQAVFAGLGLPTYRDSKNLTCMSSLLSCVFEWLGTGIGARNKRIPAAVFGWPRPLLQAFLEGLLDGDGSREEARNSLWTSSSGLASDALLLSARLGLRAGASFRMRDGERPAYQISMPLREHKLLTGVPLPDKLLTQVRQATGLSQVDASRRLGFTTASGLNNIERRSGRIAVRLRTLRRMLDGYRSLAGHTPELQRLARIVAGDLLWDEVVEIRYTGSTEPVYDLEVRPDGMHIENFLAGNGGVFASNTAGFVDAGWSGHLTLELSNVANLPITIYPGMKIGQLCLFEMTSPADKPYGERGKYQGQRGPTPSKFYEDFEKAAARARAAAAKRGPDRKKR